MEGREWRIDSQSSIFDPPSSILTFQLAASRQPLYNPRHDYCPGL
jgi:hypothetical protein